MANMEEIISRQQYEDSMGITQLREEVKRLKLTLRDQFAMAALSKCELPLYEPEHKEWINRWASTAYLIADAMLKARLKEER